MSGTYTEVVDSILDGKYGNYELDQISGAIKERRVQVASRLRYKLNTGDRVRVVGALRPKYLIGLIGVVKRVNQTTITIDFEEPEKARRYARGVRMPLEFVEKIDA
jgi:hypothetical protein